MRLLSAVVALGLMSAPALAQDAAPIVAAERAFAADGLIMGVDASFLKWAEPDAVMIAGDAPTTVTALMDPNAVFDPEAPSLVWWPNWAGVARSGELGFTTGGVEVGGERRGHYFTIWRRQPDGGWKWVYDGGTGAASAGVPGPDSEPVILPTATTGAASAEAAMAEVRAAEAALATAAATDQAAAHLSVLADDGRLYVAPLPPAIGREAYAEALAGWPATFMFGPTMGGGASQGGDLVWTYGAAAWTRAGQDRAGHYVRLWQHRPEGWRLVFAQLLPNPPPAPPAAG